MASNNLAQRETTLHGAVLRHDRTLFLQDTVTGCAELLYWETIWRWQHSCEREISNFFVFLINSRMAEIPIRRVRSA